ncbi:RNA polymerase sigma-70 factor [Dyadobacter bucti]|jgi:RNA polymerase sigma-70 factor (family 1)|uniref:RNA polymerase sigma-70 factor n=1 Tax=Dyadobacter bucti TaxID=2572203 RepID=UPI003F71BC00
MYPDNETDILPLYQRLDQEGTFEFLYNQHAPVLLRICCTFCGDEQVASDMVQEIFCSLWERRHSIEIVGPFENYLYRCAKFQYYNYCRRRATDERVLAQVGLRQNSNDLSTEREIEFNDITKSIDNLVEQLPAQCQKVYKLSRQEGLRTSEIASALLISEKTVKNHLTKALGFLRLSIRDMFLIFICLS